MSIFTDMFLDPDKTGVTMKELRRRRKLANKKKLIKEQQVYNEVAQFIETFHTGRSKQ
jgi:hypothetical protein